MNWKAVLMLMLLTTFAVHAGEDPRRAQSQEIVATFQQRLGGQLKSALAGPGGVVDAITVCRDQAPAIAAAVSDERGVGVGRTALRVRNTANSPDVSQHEIMLGFQQELAARPDSVPEWFEARPDGSARYLRAIVTQPMCLMCHGTELAPAVREALDRHYPEDAATGFQAGELRGAFVVEWPPQVADRR